MTPAGPKLHICFSKNMGMASPGVENVGAPWESIFNLSRGPQLPYIQNPNFDQKRIIYKKEEKEGTKRRTPNTSLSAGEMVDLSIQKSPFPRSLNEIVG